MNNLLLKPGELINLTNLIGKELKEVQFDMWSAKLYFDTFILFVEPDEIYIPTEGNPLGDIVTLRIKRASSEDYQVDAQSERISYGLITNVVRIECLVEIENSRPVEAIQMIPEIEIPAGQGWTNNIYDPTCQVSANRMNRVLLGLRFETQLKTDFTLYSDAVGYFVRYQKGQQLPQIFEGKCEQIRIL